MKKENYYLQGFKVEEELLEALGYRVAGMDEYCRLKNITGVFEDAMLKNNNIWIVLDKEKIIGHIQSLYIEDEADDYLQIYRGHTEYNMEVSNENLQLKSKRTRKNNQLEIVFQLNQEYSVKLQGSPSYIHIIIEHNAEKRGIYDRVEFYVGEKFDWLQNKLKKSRGNLKDDEEIFIDVIESDNSIMSHERIQGIWNSVKQRSETMNYCKFQTETSVLPSSELFDAVFRFNNDLMNPVLAGDACAPFFTDDLFLTQRENNKNKAFVYEGKYVGDFWDKRDTNAIEIFEKDLDGEGKISHIERSIEENVSLDEKIANTPEFINMYCRFKELLDSLCPFLDLQEYIDENHMLSLIKVSLQKDSDLVRKMNKK